MNLFNQFSKISESRKDQLILEHKLDNNLKNMNLPCTSNLNNFLFRLREYNRLRTHVMIDASLFDYLKTGKTQISNVQWELENLKKIVDLDKQEDVCKRLREYSIDPPRLFEDGKII